MRELLPFTLLVVAGSASLSSCTRGRDAAEVGGPSVDATQVSPQPTPFVANAGQWSDDVHYRVRVTEGEISFANQAFTISGPDRRPGAAQCAGAAVRFALVGAAPAGMRAELRLPGVHNYFLGGDQSRWRTQVPLYARLRYSAPWPGIDVVCYLVDGHLEYDLEVAPGADLGRAVFAVDGVRRLGIAADGALELETAIGTLRQSPPRTFTVDADGQRRPIEAECVLLGGNTFGFTVPGWSGDEPLLLDPGLTWGTFLGGAVNLDFVRGVHVDSAGVTTVAGNTGASDFPTTPGAWDTTYNSADCYISRLDPALSGAQQLVYSTFVGGRLSELFHALAVSSTGVVTAVGHTFSDDYPRTHPWNPQPAGDLVVTRIDPSLSGAAQLVFSRMFGGLGGETAQCVALAGVGQTVIGGYTDSSDLPVTANALQSLFNGNGTSGGTDGLIAVLDATGNVTYASFLGGTGADQIRRLWVDHGGLVHAVGESSSVAFPTTPNAFDPTYNGAGDAFLVRVDLTLQPNHQLLYSTYLGGSRPDSAASIAVDSAGVVTLAGYTESSNFPTSPGALDSTLGFNRDAFVARLDPSRVGAQQLLYSTYLGGGGHDTGGFVAVDPAGVMTVAGATGSADFPTTPGAFDRTRGGQNAFVVELDPRQLGAAQLRYGTFLGGDGVDDVFDLVRHPTGGVTVVGQTSSSAFPTTAGAYDTTYNGMADGFIVRLDLLPTGVRTFGASSPGCDGPVVIGVNSWPRRGNTGFAFTCSGAPPAAPGVLALATAGLAAPIVVLGVAVWVDPAASFFAALPTASDAGGGAAVPLPMPTQASAVGFRMAAQFVWAGPAAPPPCPPLGLSASAGLEITVQP